MTRCEGVRMEGKGSDGWLLWSWPMLSFTLSPWDLVTLR